MGEASGVCTGRENYGWEGNDCAWGGFGRLGVGQEVLAAAVLCEELVVNEDFRALAAWLSWLEPRMGGSQSTFVFYTDVSLPLSLKKRKEKERNKEKRKKNQ